MKIKFKKLILKSFIYVGLLNAILLENNNTVLLGKENVNFNKKEDETTYQKDSFITKKNPIASAIIPALIES